MALPIKDTPTLKGNDARRFAENARNAHKHPVPREQFKRAQKIYNEMKKHNKSIDF